MLTVAYYIELTWLLVDSMSGYFQNSGIFLPGNQTVGAVFRVFVLLFLVLIILKYPKNDRHITILSLLALAAFEVAFHGIFYSMSLPDVISDYQFQSKILLSILLYRVLVIQWNHGNLGIERIRKIVLFNAIVLLCNIVFGFVGIGFANYGVTEDGTPLGSKGFFYSGNECSITFVVIYALVIFVFGPRLKQHRAQFISLLFLFFLAGISLYSKTGILGYILVTLFALYFYVPRVSKIRFALVFAALLFATSGFWSEVITANIDRLRYFYQLHPDFWDFITSSRSDRIVEFQSLVSEARSPFPIIFGNGWWTRKAAPFSFENDALDLLAASGIFGLLIYLVWGGWFAVGVRTFLRSRSVDGAFVAYMMGLILMMSVLVGHTMYSAMFAPFVALVAAIPTRLIRGNTVQ